MELEDPVTGRRYLVLIGRTATGYSAYLPDLPGCVATGQTTSQIRGRIQGAFMAHLAGMREDGESIPAPRRRALQSA